jgi:hypothetical protein
MIGPPPRRKKNQYRVSKLPPFGELTVVARWEERIVNVNFAISTAVYMVTVRQLALCNRKIASWPELCKIDKNKSKTCSSPRDGHSGSSKPLQTRFFSSLSHFPVNFFVCRGKECAAARPQFPLPTTTAASSRM